MGWELWIIGYGGLSNWEFIPHVVDLEATEHILCHILFVCDIVVKIISEGVGSYESSTLLRQALPAHPQTLF